MKVSFENNDWYNRYFIILDYFILIVILIDLFVKEEKR